MTTKRRPKHLNLVKIRFPSPAIASILHRISGLFIFLLTPVLLYLFALSLQGESGFRLAGEWLNSVFVKIALIPLIWLSVHHFIAGIRYLMLDLDIGLNRASARISALTTIAMALVLSVLTIYWLIL